MPKYQTVLDCFEPTAKCDNCNEVVGYEPEAGHTDDDVLLCAGCWVALFPRRAKMRRAAYLRANPNVKWGIVTGQKYVSRKGKKMAWTRNYAEAEKWAKALGGRVVDAEKFCTARG